MELDLWRAEMPIAQWLNEICLISHVPTSGNSTGMRGRNSARIENSEWGEAGIPENRELGMGRSGNLENTSGLENGLLSTNVILATLWDLSTLRRLWTYWALRGLLRIVVD